jgi:hypothetical protein
VFDGCTCTRCIYYCLSDIILISFYLTLSYYKVVYKKLSLSGEVDNPDRDEDIKRYRDWHAGFTPSNATQTVRWAQITALVTYLIFADATVKDIVKSSETMPKIRRKNWWCNILIALMFPCWTALIVNFYLWCLEIDR